MDDRYGPEHLAQARAMMADFDAAWAGMDKQVAAAAHGDAAGEEFWRLCFVAFCELWGERASGNEVEYNLIMTAAAYARGARAQTAAEREETERFHEAYMAAFYAEARENSKLALRQIEWETGGRQGEMPLRVVPGKNSLILRLCTVAGEGLEGERQAEKDDEFPF